MLAASPLAPRLTSGSSPRRKSRDVVAGPQRWKACCMPWDQVGCGTLESWAPGWATSARWHRHLGLVHAIEADLLALTGGEGVEQLRPGRRVA